MEIVLNMIGPKEDVCLTRPPGLITDVAKGPQIVNDLGKSTCWPQSVV